MVGPFSPADTRAMSGCAFPPAAQICPGAPCLKVVSVPGRWRRCCTPCSTTSTGSRRPQWKRRASGRMWSGSSTMAPRSRPAVRSASTASTAASVAGTEQYSPCSPDGSKYIFVVRTLTGDFTAGQQDMRAPPLRQDGAVPRRYDSVVDNPSKPSIFVIFNDTQAYPKYLITCQRTHQR
uniref:PARP catalytic domain-containing protein n=1 Tax=Sphenodon punctatus TaxID=8508 RepID=A0A8D0HVP8_SPHPU